MNFLGLGILFSAKDQGLLDHTKEVSKGFLGMTSAYGRFNAAMGRENFNLKKERGMRAAAATLAAYRAQLGKTNPLSEKYAKILNKIQTLQGNMNLAKAIKRDATELANLRQRLMNFPKGSQEYLDTLEKMKDKEEEIANKREHLGLKLGERVEKLAGHASFAAGLMQEIGHDGLNLTTHFEGMMQANEKAARQVALNYGYTGKELTRISNQAAGMAVSLNMGAEETARALRAWGAAQKDLTAIGFRSAAEVAKFASVTGVSADSMVDMTRRMRKELQLSEKGLQMVMGTFTRFGQETGNVSAALEAVPQLLGTLSKQAANAGYELDEMKLARFGTEIASLARGLHATGSSQQDALHFAEQMAEHLVTARADLGKMFAGTRDDIPAMAQSLAIGIGDANEAFALMNRGPETFMSGLAKMVQAAKKNGNLTGQQLDFLHRHLAETFGEESAARMVNFFKSADAATLKTMADVKQTTSNLGKLANEGYRTGRTLAESFSLAQERFVASFRQISRHDARDFVRDTSTEFAKFGKTVQKLGAEDGMMGTLVRQFSLFHQLGYLSLVPKTLRPMASLFGGILKEIMPLLPSIAALGAVLGFLVSPIGLIIAGLGAAGGLIYWFGKADVAGSKAGRSMGKSWDMVKSKLGGVWESVKSFAGRAVDRFRAMWPEILKGVGDFVRAAGVKISEFASRIPDLFDEISPGLIAFAKTIGPPMLEAIWDVGVGLLKGMGRFAIKVLDSAYDSFMEWWTGSAQKDLPNAFSKAFDLLEDAGTSAWYSVKDAFNGFMGWVRKTAVYLLEIWPKMKEAAVNAVTAIFDRFRAWGAWMEEKLVAWPKAFRSLFSSSSGQVTPMNVPAPVAAPPVPSVPQGAAPGTRPSGPSPGLTPAQAAAMVNAVHNPKWYEEYRRLYSEGVDRVVTAIAAQLPQTKRQIFKQTLLNEIGINHLLGTDTVGNPRR